MDLTPQEAAGDLTLERPSASLTPRADASVCRNLAAYAPLV
jgi:hypothetical protein